MKSFVTAATPVNLLLALVLTARPRVVALDEPTRGLDYTAKEQLASVVLQAHSRSGATEPVESLSRLVDGIVANAPNAAGPDGRRPGRTQGLAAPVET